MHIVLLPLLCCFSLIAMDANEKDTTQLLEKFFITALSYDCVASNQGFIFKKDPHHPIACLSTLMLLYQGKKSQKELTNLKCAQGFLQAKIKEALAANTKKPERAFEIALSAFSRFRLQYGYQGHIQLITPQEL